MATVIPISIQTSYLWIIVLGTLVVTRNQCMLEQALQLAPFLRYSFHQHPWKAPFINDLVPERLACTTSSHMLTLRVHTCPLREHLFSSPRCHCSFSSSTAALPTHCIAVVQPWVGTWKKPSVLGSRAQQYRLGLGLTATTSPYCPAL